MASPLGRWVSSALRAAAGATHGAGFQNADVPSADSTAALDAAVARLRLRLGAPGPLADAVKNLTMSKMDVSQAKPIAGGSGGAALLETCFADGGVAILTVGNEDIVLLAGEAYENGTLRAGWVLVERY